MGPTPPRRLVLATVAAALVATGVAAPAQAWTTPAPARMPVPAFAAGVVTPLGEATTLAAAGWRQKPVRRHRLQALYSPVDPAGAEVLRLVNVQRAGVGCPAVRWEPRLATAARLHSEDMARQDYFSHTSLDGRSPWERIRAQGYAYGSAENIAAGYSTPSAVMTGWMNSPGHRANILDCANLALGVGTGTGGRYGTYWTQDFGSH